MFETAPKFSESQDIPNCNKEKIHNFRGTSEGGWYTKEAKVGPAKTLMASAPTSVASYRWITQLGG